jgi:hypothetical protein
METSAPDSGSGLGSDFNEKWPKIAPKKQDKFLPQNGLIFSKFFALNVFPHRESKPTQGFQTLSSRLHKSCGKMRWRLKVAKNIFVHVFRIIWKHPTEFKLTLQFTQYGKKERKKGFEV